MQFIILLIIWPKKTKIAVKWWKNILIKNLCWLKFWKLYNNYVGNDVKVRGHCHITGKYGSSAHRDCNINFKLNHKTSVLFHNLNNYDSHLIMQELAKFNLKKKCYTKGIRKIYIYWQLPIFNFFIR